MSKVLPGSDKYQTPLDDSDAPWNHPLVLLANQEVRIEDVLNDHFGMHVPRGAEGWKVRCPLYREHADGGIDRQFRVYSSGNHGHCFALHGTLDPVRLWRLRAFFPTIKAAAEDLLASYGIDHRPRPYWERMRALREAQEFTADPDVIVAALRVFLRAQPTYTERQFDPGTLHVVKSVLSEVHTICGAATHPSEIETWFTHSKDRLLRVLESGD